MALSKRIGTRKLGWCLDQLHDRCPRTTPNLQLVCACDCHDTPPQTSGQPT